METENESKEFFLVAVECTASWRASLIERYPEDKHNLVASERLMKLHDYLKSLPAIHPIFTSYYKVMSSEIEVEVVNHEIRCYGYQNPEEPEEFVARILKNVQS